MHHRTRVLWLVLSLALVLSVASAVAGAETEYRPYDFLTELATVQPIPGFPSNLFSPEHRPSRFEIAFFLFRVDQSLATVAHPEGLDLQGALAQVWMAANPRSGEDQAEVWADKANGRYRRLLLEYNREMRALGFRLSPDAYPSWSKRSATDVCLLIPDRQNAVGRWSRTMEKWRGGGSGRAPHSWQT